MKISLLSLVFCCALSVTAQSIKVITFNIRLETDADGNDMWDLRKPSVADFLMYEEPDFLGMQEALLSQIRDLEGILDVYHRIGVGRDDGQESGEFSPIFYQPSKWKLLSSGTFWLAETPDQPSKSWDAALPRICTWGQFRQVDTKQTLFIFNTHFDHIGVQAREKSAELILQKIKELADGYPVVLMGDLNAEPVQAPIQLITSGGLKDAFEAAPLRFGQEGTFNGFKYDEIPSRRIDYVFVNDAFQVQKYAVDSRIINGRFLSDHFPVIVQLKLKNPDVRNKKTNKK